MVGIESAHPAGFVKTIHTRIVLGEFADGLVRSLYSLDLCVDPIDRYAVYISDLGAYPAGCGTGRRVMAALLAAADDEGVRLSLVPGAEFGRPGVLSHDALVAWYERLGFGYTGSVAMYREPCPTLPTSQYRVSSRVGSGAVDGPAGSGGTIEA